MATIWYVHGSGGTELSFRWLQQQLPSHQAKFFSYPVNESTQTCITRLQRSLACDPEPIILIGHSLGGIIAFAACIGLYNITGLVTLCAPFAGLKYASMAALLSNAPLFRDMHQYSGLLIELRASRLIIPHLAIVASKGLPHINEPNDGVVTVASQTSLPGQNYSAFAINHFEVLLSPDVAATIDRFLIGL